jgi:hypothetical protein
MVEARKFLSSFTSEFFSFTKTFMKWQTSLKLETNSSFKNLAKFYGWYIIYTMLLNTILILINACTNKINNRTNNNKNSVFAWVCGRSLFWFCKFESRQVQWCLYLVGVVCCQAENSVGLLICPVDSYRLWCVWAWSWNLNNMETLAHVGLLRLGGKTYYCFVVWNSAIATDADILGAFANLR